MVYTPQVWHDDPATDTPESAARFTYMETGIQSGNADATASVKGLIQLAGDLAGTAAAPTLRTTLNDPAAATPGLRTLGTGAQQALPGNTALGGVPSGAAGGSLSGTYPNPGLALVPNPPVALTFAASLTPVATVGNYRVCTVTAALTLNPPTSPADGQLLRIRFIASGGPWVLTFAAGFRLLTGITSALSIPSGKRADVGLTYETADAAWTVIAAGAQQ